LKPAAACCRLSRRVWLPLLDTLLFSWRLSNQPAFDRRRNPFRDFVQLVPAQPAFVLLRLTQTAPSAIERQPLPIAGGRERNRPDMNGSYRPETCLRRDIAAVPSWLVVVEKAPKPRLRHSRLML
jgi:hypothetical protein